jgi:hypothetical protein
MSTNITRLCWLLGTSVLKSMILLLIDSFFSELWHTLMKGCKSLSCASNQDAEVCAIRPLLQ